MILADLGADVIRVERPGGQRPGRRRARPAQPGPTQRRPRPQGSRGGPTVLLELVASADVLVEGMRPGVAERLGLGPEDCRAVNERLVYARMTGWGQDGPLATAAGHDMNYVAITGALFGLGQDKTRPHFPTNLVGDFGGGSTYLVIGILRRPARGSGQRPGPGGRRRDRRRHRPPERDDRRLPRRRRATSRSGPPTCSTAACRSTTSTRPPTAGTCRSGRWSRSSSTRWSTCSASPDTAPGPARAGAVRRAAGAARRAVRRPHPGRVGRALRGHRRLRRRDHPALARPPSTRT